VSLLSIGVSALTSNRQALDTTGHNISNVNTEGYSRQRVDFATREANATGSHYVGSGVKTASISRQYDEFLASQLRSSQSAAAELDVYYTSASRLDDILASTDSGLQPALEGFFDAVQELADDPASTSARQVLLAEAESLADRFQYLDGEFARSRDRLNDQVVSSVDEINRIAANIAELNSNIVTAFGTSASALPNDMLDQRDQLINELSQLVDIQVLEQSDGATNVFIGKGQPLVMASDAANLTTQVSSEDATKLDIAFNFPYGTQIVTEQLTGGTIGGLVRFREEVLDPAHNQIGLIALGVAEELNSQHQLGVDLDGMAGTALFSMGSPQALSATGTGTTVTLAYDDIGQLTGSDYSLLYDGANFILTRLSDNTTQTLQPGPYDPITNPEPVVDGLNIQIDATAAVSGDRILIQPVRNGARDFDSLISDTSRLAAASPLLSQPTTVNGNPANLGDGQISLPTNSTMTGLPMTGDMNLVFDAAAGGYDVFYPGTDPAIGPADDFIAYDTSDQDDVAGLTVPSAQFTAFGGMSFTLSGIPQDGDSFVISNNTDGTSDNRNALSMADLQTDSLLLGDTSSFAETFSQLVADVGAKTHQAEVNLAAQEGLVERSETALGSISGVNLDEEAAKLIQYQQAYQASAQMINVANTLFDTLLSAVR
jgi:flagellar hook-associated protein 1 FlgK